MIRVALYLIGILALTAGLDWLAKRPGIITVDWLGYNTHTSVFWAIVILAGLLGLLVLTWSILRQIWRSPAALGRYLNRRRQQRGLDALTGGIIAVGAGDQAAAVRYAAQARRALPHEPLTHLLRAQAAQISDDRATARRIFEAMLASPDTEQLGLRGLFLEAEQEGEREAARQFAERALARNPKLGWPVEALFDLQCHAGDWEGALEMLGIAEHQRLLEKPQANRRRAVLLTAQAQALEDAEPERALELALDAHRLARDLVPAAAIAGRILASRGRTPKAARVLLKTWRHSPHPDLATAYAYARPGDSPRDRLNRVRHLARLTPNHVEAQIAVATSAIEARSWDEAREALKPLLEERLTPRVCTLMARIEGEQYGDAGRVREWLARAMAAPRDPAWTADGTASDRWSPVSPVTGELDAMRWRVPEGGEGDRSAAEALAARLEAVVRAGIRTEARADASAADAAPKPAPAAPTLQQTEATEAKLLPATAASPSPRQPDAAAPAAATPPQTRREPPQVEVLAPTDVPFKRDAAARPRKPVETKIFVSPRAPDDPGTGEIDDLQGYPTSGAKA
jgi:HemY protein